MRGNLRELDKSTIIAGAFHRPLSNRTNRQKISEDMEELHHLIHQFTNSAWKEINSFEGLFRKEILRSTHLSSHLQTLVNDKQNKPTSMRMREKVKNRNQ